MLQECMEQRLLDIHFSVAIVLGLRPDLLSAFVRISRFNPQPCLLQHILKLMFLGGMHDLGCRVQGLGEFLNPKPLTVGVEV